MEVDVQSLSHEGRGVALVGGKTTFVEGALPGERVRMRYARRRGRFDEGVALEILQEGAGRVPPRCPHAGICGGCGLQHLHPEAQIRHKQAVLLEQLGHIGGVAPEAVLAPLTGPLWGYRHKARLAVKFVPGKGGVLVGFRERAGPYVADIHSCVVLHPSVGERLPALRELVTGLSVARALPQIEVAVGDERTALVFRHLQPLSDADRVRLQAFATDTGIRVFLQPGGLDSVHPLAPADAPPLSYRLPAFNLELQFSPVDFTQINAAINRAMVDRVVGLMDPGPEDAVLDLFCGLGNFSLPLARRAGRVVGVEGDPGLVERARANARHNGIDNAEFQAQDLTGDLERGHLAGGYSQVLLDPPRTGALEAVQRLSLAEVRRLVYVSCNPATLARDAGVLVRERGLRLRAAGVMDMFPHTRHVESLAVFEAP